MPKKLPMKETKVKSVKVKCQCFWVRGMGGESLTNCVTLGKLTSPTRNLFLNRGKGLPSWCKIVFSQSYGFSSSHVWMWELDYKEAERWRIDAFEMWCWRRLLRVPWIARRANQSILKEISAEYSLEGMMLKLKLQYFGHLMQRTDSFEKTLMLGKSEVGGEGDNRERGGWKASPIRWT